MQARRTATRIFMRLLGALPVIAVAVILAFIVARLLPGDPAHELAGGMQASASGIAELRHRLGIDASLGVQLQRYALGLVQGDWGQSFMTGRPVLVELRSRLPASLELTFFGLLLSACIGIPLGVAAGMRPDGWTDRICRLLSTIGGSLPSFFVGLLLIDVLYFHLGWAPEPIGQLDPFLTTPSGPSGWLLIDSALAGNGKVWRDVAAHLFLPAVTMAVFGVPPLARLTRDAVHDAVQSDAVRTARVLGLHGTTVLLHYVLKPSTATILTALGMVFSYMLSANVAVEKVFGWPGIGAYAIDALATSDYAPLQGFILCVALLFTVVNLLIDGAIALIDPRAREQR